MSRPLYRWARGASIFHAVEVNEDPGGILTGTEQVRCVAKKIANIAAPPPGDDAPDDLVLATAFVAASGDSPAHWTVTGAPSDTEALTPGYYAVDFRLVLESGAVIQTPVVVLEITGRVTEASG
jgi:hypothetical protein